MSVKIRTYSKSESELWLAEWNNPLAGELSVNDELIDDLGRLPDQS